MSPATTQRESSTTAIIFAVFAVACVVAFLAFRGSDVGQLPQLVGNLGGGDLFGPGVFSSVAGLVVGIVIYLAWYGTGGAVLRFVSPDIEIDPVLRTALRAGIGAAVWSLVWFFLGLTGLYNSAVAVAVVVVGAGLALAAAATGIFDNAKPLKR